MATQRTNEGITLANRDCVKTKIEQSLEDKATLKALGYGPKQWRRAWRIIDDPEFQCDGFLDALAVFI